MLIRFFPLVLKFPKITDANFVKIAGAKVPIAPVLNTPLLYVLFWSFDSFDKESLSIKFIKELKNGKNLKL